MSAALRAVGGVALVALWVVWWAPTGLLFALQLAAARARFGLVMAWGDALRAMGQTEAARRLYLSEVARCERRRRALARRRG